MLLTQIICAALMVWGVCSAIRSDRWPTRFQVLTRLLTTLTIILFIRLIADFGGWDGWFIYVWLAGMLAFGYGVFRVADVWPDLPWRNSAPGGGTTDASMSADANASTGTEVNAPTGTVAKTAATDRRRETRGLVIGAFAVFVVAVALVVPGTMIS